MYVFFGTNVVLVFFLSNLDKKIYIYKCVSYTLASIVRASESMKFHVNQ